MPVFPSRRMLLGANMLPIALALTGCEFDEGPGGASTPGGSGSETTGPVTADGPASDDAPPSPDRCLSAEDAAQRTRPAPPERDDMGPENEAHPGALLSEHGLALFAGGDRILAGQSSDALMLGESETFGTVVWSTADGSILERFDNGLIGAIAADQQGRLALGGVVNVELRDDKTELLGALTGGDEPIGPRIGRLISDLAFTSDGAHLVVLGADGQVTVWSTSDGECGLEHKLNTTVGAATALSVSPLDNTVAVCGPDGPVELWDPSTGESAGIIENLPSTPTGVTHAPDGTLIICTDGERAVHALSPSGDLVTGPELTASGPYWAAAAADGRVAVVARGDNRVLLWDRTADQTSTLPVVQGSVGRLVWSADSSTLYGASAAQGVIAWSGSDQWRQFETP